jgi:hypothetical protein
MRRLRRVIQAVIVDYEGICNFKKRWKERDAVPDSRAEDAKREREVAAAAVVCNLFFSLLSV